MPGDEKSPSMGFVALSMGLSWADIALAYSRLPPAKRAKWWSSFSTRTDPHKETHDGACRWCIVKTKVKLKKIDDAEIAKMNNVETSYVLYSYVKVTGVFTLFFFLWSLFSS